MASIRQILPNYTVEDYESWEGRWEIINGIAIAMSPMPSPRHQNIAGKVFRIIDEALEQTPCNHCKVYQPIDYKISETTVVNPDILVACAPINGQYLDFPPHLIVEILSPSTAFKDRNTKFDLYQSEGVKYYIMIDPSDESIDIYTLDDHMIYTKTNKTTFHFADDCEVILDFAKSF
ncbi:MAG: Uma2 family endonuclease [Saprospiraceae bacterium]|nr:Uma2 family endonuclease [Saprospiraceae bacterium]